MNISTAAPNIDIRETQAVCSECSSGITFRDTDEIVTSVPIVRKFQNEPVTLWRCTHCLTIHCLESIDLDRYYADYPVTKMKLGLGLKAAYRNRVVRLRASGVNPQDSVLDYGCGVGLFLKYLKQKQFTSVSGYDRYVPEFNNDEAIARHYACVCSQDVIEHVESPRSFMAKVTALVQPGGLLVVGTPDAAEINLDKEERFRFELSPPYHRHIITRKLLAELGNELGLSVERVIRKSYLDTLLPTFNFSFLRNYFRLSGSSLDALFEPPPLRLLPRMIGLIPDAFFGAFWSPRTNVEVHFRKPL